MAALDLANAACREVQRLVPGRLPKAVIGPHERIEQTVLMVRLHVTLDAFWTELSRIEGKVLPRFKPDHVVVTDLELNSALLAAEATVRLYQAVRRARGFILPATRWNVAGVRAVVLC